MNVILLDYYPLLRLSCFFGIFFFMALWEVALPRRALQTSKRSRWFANLSLTFLNTMISRFAFPIPAVALALLAEERGWGLFNHLHLPFIATGLISIIFLDLIIYLQHLVFHRTRIFWYIHRMHHTDLDIDVTTGTRFHPIEIILSLLIKMAAVLLFGIPAWSFVIFEVLLNATSVFNHGNIGMDTQVDRFLRIVVVTPDMHRVHHSILTGEHNSNYGFNLSLWDRLFGTYTAQPQKGHEDMIIGLANFRDPKALSLPRLLLLPFDILKKL
ncbi:MAG TPA: sterol desaturase family protein [Syntrophorhabdaceae bacterium]|nr:sterol desaturase family protein [Syntrophorhabdaceae bacterium]